MVGLLPVSAGAPALEELLAFYALPDRVTPRVRVNFVQSADGAVTLGGRSGALGGATDRAVMQVLRTMADVVVVGAGTVRAEGYAGVDVDADAVAWRRAHGLGDQPAFAVVSRRLDLEPDAEVFTGSRHPPLVVTRADAPVVRREALAAIAEVIDCGDESVDLAAMLAAFADRGWTQVLCEGGPHLFGALLDAGLVDELCVTIAPRLAGGGAGRIAQGASEADRRVDLAGSFADDEGFVFLRYVARQVAGSV